MMCVFMKDVCVWGGGSCIRREYLCRHLCLSWVWRRPSRDNSITSASRLDIRAMLLSKRKDSVTQQDQLVASDCSPDGLLAFCYRVLLCSPQLCLLIIALSMSFLPRSFLHQGLTLEIHHNLQSWEMSSSPILFWRNRVGFGGELKSLIERNLGLSQ